MKISTRGRYAVMAMADIAQQEGKAPARPPAPVSLSSIAGRQEIPLPYLEQIFQDLRGAGLVESVRGAKGGYRLCRMPAQTLIGDIIDSVDEVVEVTRCKSTPSCLSKQGRCLTHDLWAALESQIHNFLNHVSLADVINGTFAVTEPVVPADTMAKDEKNIVKALS